MNDNNETIPSKLTLDLPPDPKKFQMKPFLIIGSTGCVLLFCLGLLAFGGLFAGSSLVSASNPETTTLNEAVAAREKIELRATEALSEKENEAGTEPLSEEENGDGAEAIEVETTQTDREVDQASAKAAPTMGSITFALETTAEGAPVEPNFSFEEGVTQLHAVFDYEGLSPETIWTQVWYHNGNEVLSTSQPWPEAESGTFDYLVQADGQPLPTGAWALEFYVNEELLTAGSFTIESTAEPVATGEAPDLADLPKLYKIVYTRWNGEKHDLYIGDTNGSAERFILGRAAGPSWSADGRYIFFYGEEGVDQQVVNGTVIPLPGTTNGIARLTASPLPAGVKGAQLFQGHGWNDGTARSANISPDGSMIAYDGDRGGGRRIYFLGTAANQQFRYEIIGEQADWSPNSQKVVYRSGRNNQTGLWISNRTDSGHFRITSGGTDSFPAWSPDGQTIAFSRDVGGNVDIYTVKVDGSELKRLTEAPGHDTLPLYLPNGDLIFRSARGGSWGIWKMKGDGSGQTQIIANAPVGPEWSFSRMGVLR